MDLKSDNSSKGRSDYDGPRPGDVVAGKYEIQQIIGAGGMGVVLSARHIHLQQRVAIKFLRGKAHPELVVRFMREARAAAAIKSEHVVKVTDVDRLPSGEPFMVMEFLAGRNLSKVIRAHLPSPLPVQDACDYILQACEAVGEAHGHGIVHRDLKPGNLFLTTRPDGSSLVKVLDFGISKFTEEGVDEETLTATNMILGSPQYASPEQLRNVKGADSRTDIWALGIILYYMLTGKRPFDAEAVSALCLAIATEQPPPMRSIRPELHPDLEETVMRCLVKDRSRRTQTVAELVNGLRRFAPNHEAKRISRGSIPSDPQTMAAATHAMGGGGALFSSHHAALGEVADAAREAMTAGRPLPAGALVVGAGGFAGAGGTVGMATDSGQMRAGGSFDGTVDPLGGDVPSTGSLQPLPRAQVELNTAGTRAAWAAAGAPSAHPSKRIAVQLGILGLVLATSIAVFFVVRSDEPQSVGDIEGSMPATPTPVATAKAARTPVPPKSSAAPVAPNPPPQGIQVGVGVPAEKLTPDGKPEKPIRAGDYVNASTTLSLRSSPASSIITGTVHRGSALWVQQVRGDWFLVRFSAAGSSLSGWTPKDTVARQ